MGKPFRALGCSRCVVLASLLAGCAALPVTAPPRPGLPPAYPQADAAQAPQLPVDRWWSALGDPQLDALIDAAQAGNHDVRSAVSRVAQARAVLPAVDSRRLPALDLGGAASTSHSGLPDAVKRGMPDTRAVQLNLNLGWELDLMGAAAATARGARSDLESAQWGVRGAQQMVANEVARQYLRVQASRRSAMVAQAIVDTFDASEALLQSRVREGTGARIDLDRLGSARASARAALPGLRAEQAAALDALAVLMGKAPGTVEIAIRQDVLPSAQALDPRPLLQAGTGLLADPGVPPVGQPADLLRRRPDIQAAAFRDQSARARLQEAHADRYPRFFLSALFGGERLTLNGTPYSPVAYSNAALAFSAPLFDGERRAALERVQAGAVDETGLAYEQVVLRAVEEVDVSLAVLKAQRERHQHVLAARDLALAALERVRTLQREGEIDTVGVLELVRAAFDAQLAVLDAERDRGLALIQLYAALGGGWSDTALSPPESSPVPERHP